MKTILVPLAALFGAAAFTPIPASALPFGPTSIQETGLVEQAGWAQNVERGGKRFFRTTKRHAPKRAVSSNGNVDRPDRRARQAHWGQMPGGPKRHGQ